ncbi:MAG: hypothetical protein GXP44_00125, partial [bacterium]|nr:hypothetical protein [bacterium]
MKNIRKFVFAGMLLGILVVPIFASANTVTDLQAQISVLLAQVQNLQKQLGQIKNGSQSWCHNFNVNLKIGNRGSEVTALQIALEKENFIIGSNKGYFGEGTASAVTGFQQKYKNEILTPVGLRYGTGFFGPSTRAKLNEIYGCSSGNSNQYSAGDVGDANFHGLAINENNSKTKESSVTVLSPNGGETWKIGKTYTIRWDRSKLPEGVNWKIFIDLVEYKTAYSASQHSIFTNIPNSGYVNWTVSGSVNPGNYRILIMAIKPGEYNAKYSDTSNGMFSIIPINVSNQVRGLMSKVSNDSVILNWQRVFVAAGEPAVGVYNIYRDTSPKFEPNRRNLIAQGNVLTYTDNNLLP